MAVREVLVKNADATYNYFDTRVYEMSAVLYALDDQKIFTLAFYCKAATRLVEMYYAQKPDFQEQEERLSKEIERIEKLAESLEEVNTANLSEPSWCRGTKLCMPARSWKNPFREKRSSLFTLRNFSIIWTGR